jgi:hypothetical protein
MIDIPLTHGSRRGPLVATPGYAAAVSDNWLVVFPADPDWVPTVDQQARAGEVIARLAPSTVAGQPEFTRTAGVEFIDAGGNFEAIRCPLCDHELEASWWQDQMDQQYSRETGFRLATITAPCCGGPTALNKLAYEWPLGFARWSARVLYPDRSWLTAAELGEIGEALGQPVRQTFRHI